MNQLAHQGGSVVAAACWVAAGAACMETSCEVVLATVCAELAAGCSVAWVTARAWSLAASGVVVFGGESNGDNTEAAAEEAA